MGSFCRFYIQGFTFQVACEPLIIYGKRNDSVCITLSKCQCKWFRRLKAVFLEISEVQSVSQECKTTEITGNRRKVINFVFTCLDTVPVEWLAAECFKPDLLKEEFQPFTGVRIRFYIRKLSDQISTAFFAEQCHKMSFPLHFMREKVNTAGKHRIAVSPCRYSGSEAFVSRKF